MVRSWGALVVGIILLGVTVYVLFEDVLRNDAKITTDHLLTIGVLLAVAAAGHMVIRELAGWRPVTGIGLIVIFVVGCAYLVVASGGRNAEVAIAKRNAAHLANEERQRIKPLLERAEKMLEEERAALAKETKDGGCGKKCEGIKVSVAVYEAAVKGHEAALKELGPEQEEDANLKSFARVLSAWYGIPEDRREAAEKVYVARLVTVMPYGKALLVEFATVVFLGVAIGHRRGTVAGTVPQTSEGRRTVPRSSDRAKPSGTVPGGTILAFPRRGTVPSPGTVPKPGTVPLSQEQSLELLLGRLAADGTVAQDGLKELFGVKGKSTVSRWLAEWEGQGLIARVQAGRCKAVVRPSSLAS